MDQVTAVASKTGGTELTQQVTNVSIVGLGYVGLPLALLSARKGYAVVGIDVDEKKVASINTGVSPFFDGNIARELLDTKMQADTKFSRVQDSDIVIVCVPTPVREDYSPDLEPLESACAKLAPYLKKGALVIIESTVNPGACESVVLPIIERVSGLKAGTDFMLSHCPERINPGDPNWGVENIHRVAGSLTPEGLEKTVAFYSSIVTGTVHPMKSIKEAEAVKIIENTFRDINIAFVNELAMSFDKMGIDIMNVIQGASTKPFAFMPHFPSCGVGGHCIPVDPYYLIEEGRRNGFEHEFLSLARKINNNMPVFTVDLLERTLTQNGRSLEGAQIAVLGLAYKANVGDVRESPSVKIIEELKHRNAKPVIYDPYVPARSDVISLSEALSGSAAALVATAHREFAELAPKTFLDHGVSIVIDGKNCLHKEDYLSAGIAYRGIGR